MEKISKVTKEKSFNDINHFYGRLFMVAAIFIIVLVPVIMAIALKTAPNLGVIVKTIPALITFIIGGFIEVTTYAPLLGTSGTYLAFFTGNLINLKVPCAVNAREQAKAQIGTKYSEIISTVSIGSSAIVTTLVIALGVAMLVPLTPVLESPTLTPAFALSFTSLFGALAYKYFSKDLKLVPLPLFICFVLQYFLVIGTGILIPVAAVLSILFSYFLYKKGKI